MVFNLRFMDIGAVVSVPQILILIKSVDCTIR